MPPLKALMLLQECTGVDIWPVDHCRSRGIPEDWIEELADAFESGFDRDVETIYFQDRPVNQFHGILDFDLAIRLGQQLGLDVARITAHTLSPRDTVRAIQEAAEEEI
jgi:hypothetical protein